MADTIARPRNPPGTIDFLLRFNAATKAAQLGDSHEAKSQIQQAISASPVIAGALANSLLRSGDFQAAIDLYSQVISNPDTSAKVKALSLNDIGMAFSRCGNRDMAHQCFTHAVSLLRDSPEIWYNLGLAEAWTGNWEAKIKCIERALRLKPNFHDAHFSRATSLLTIGDYENGFREYESRWKSRLTKPDWGCLDLQYLHQAEGKTVLVYAEQGAGDTIQMLRYLPLLKRTAAKIIASVQPPLLKLVQQLCPDFADLFVNADTLKPEHISPDLPPFQCSIPFMSLPRLFGATQANLPPAPYLPTPEPLPLEAGTFKVGLVWAGSPDHTDDKWRSIPFRHFEPILSLSSGSGIAFYNLQVGLRAIDGMFEDRLRRFSFGSYLDTARALAAIDLVITVDTSVAHLAGAMNLPAWVLIPYCPDWRWGLQTENCAWYKSVTLFRQPKPDDWETPITNIVNRLYDHAR